MLVLPESLSLVFVMIGSNLSVSATIFTLDKQLLLLLLHNKSV